MAAKPQVYPPYPGSSTIKAPLPAPPSRQFSFTGFSQNNPTTPQPGDRLDAEYDRTNQSVSGLITFCSVTFNTDGSLKPGSVGQPQLDPNVYDDIVQTVEGDLQVYVDNAFAYASSALTSSTSAQQSATQAATSSNNAQGAASTATAASSQAGQSAGAANISMLAAQTSATEAANSNNATSQDAALCTDLSVVSQAWAEHMPDTIPPNILAAMNITGDHWSSRWWANQAATVVEDADNNLNEIGQGWVDTINEVGGGYQESLQSQYEKYLAQFQTLYLGAFLYPPVADAQGNPVATGALYYNIALNAPYVWNGTQWVPFLTPAPPDISRYVYVATAGQTIFSGPDRYGHNLSFSTANNRPLYQVFHSKLLLTPDDDYTLGSNAVTLHTPSAAGDIVQLFVAEVPQVNLDWQTVKVDTSAWTPSGGVLRDMSLNPVTPASSSDIFVNVNGVWQNPGVDYVVSASSIAFIPPFEADAHTYAIAIVPTTVSQAPGAAVTKLDTSSWVFNGTNTTFPLLDSGGSPVGTAAVNLLLSLDGVWQNALVDYTVANTFVTFTTPPQADTHVFAISGLPAFTAAAT